MEDSLPDLIQTTELKIFRISFFSFGPENSKISEKYWGYELTTLKPHRRITWLICVSLLLSCQLGCNALPERGLTADGKKVYFDTAPIQQTDAYKNFLKSSRSETAKLYYLLDRIKAARNLSYYFEGDRYNWLEAYMAATWLLWHHYDKNKNARDFVDEEIARYQMISKTTTIQFPNQSHHIAANVMVNELELLENTIAAS